MANSVKGAGPRRYRFQGSAAEELFSTANMDITPESLEPSSFPPQISGLLGYYPGLLWCQVNVIQVGRKAAIQIWDILFAAFACWIKSGAHHDDNKYLYHS